MVEGTPAYYVLTKLTLCASSSVASLWCGGQPLCLTVLHLAYMSREEARGEGGDGLGDS